MIGLLFGSFDPVHIGHITIAEWALTKGGCSEVWLVLSPQNPMKATSAAPYQMRKAMVEMAIEGMECIKLCTVESELTPPFYTINTIEKLQSDFPDEKFVILCGTDVKKQSHKWHRHCDLFKLVEFKEYPRHRNDSLPFIDISSTEVRCGLKPEMVNPQVLDYIKENEVYNCNLEQGRAYYNEGKIGEAINHWQMVTPQSRFYNEAKTLIELASNILAYSYTEIYNP